MQTYLYSNLWTPLLFRYPKSSLCPKTFSQSNNLPRIGFHRMSNSTTSTVYVQVIEDVVTKIREEFINNAGPGEAILNQLQGLWELKMMQAGGILGPVDTSSSIKSTTPSNAVRDLNVPYEGPDEYETPTAELLFPPTPLQTPMPGQTPPLPGTAPTPLPGTVDTSYNIPTGETPITPNDFSHMKENGVIDNRVGRPSLYMQPPVSWLNKRPPLDVHLAYVDGREEVERGSASQHRTQDFLQVPSGKRKREDFPCQFRPDGYIPQQDGAVDIYNYQGVVSEDYNVAGKTDPPIQEQQTQTPAMVNQNDVLDDDEDEPLNENDDDDDLDDVDQGEELNTHHVVLAQFDKVTRTKSRWKCTLKDGIMRINNKDMLFNKASGEFDF